MVKNQILVSINGSIRLGDAQGILKRHQQDLERRLQGVTFSEIDGRQYMITITQGNPDRVAGDVRKNGEDYSISAVLVNYR